MQEFLHKHIKSFVIRSGHITDAQRNTRARLTPLWGIQYRPELIDFKAIFGNDHPVILEIGFGMGETTAAMAAVHPEWNFLGIEVYPAGVGALLSRIEKEDLKNIRVMEHDVVDVLAHMIPDESLAAVHIYFPDPWPKKRHHKRRLIQPGLVQRLCAKLAAEGYIHMATDWPEYAEQMLEVLSAEPLLQNTSPKGGFAPRPQWRPLTKFEQRGIRLGHPVADLLFQKTPAAASTTSPNTIR
jgi:tRNA (guanine-N7-)-methyltransferase